MLPFKLKLSKSKIESLQGALSRSEKLGDYAKFKKILSISLLAKDKTISEISELLCISCQAIRNWLNKYLTHGIRGLKNGSSPGRPSKLTKTQRKELASIIKAGPEKSGFPGACWRTPMIQHFIKEKYGVFYNAHYISQLLHNMGFSYQKAKFVASKQDKKARKEWLEKTWPKILKLADKKNSHVLFGDEASFPQWGTLSYTWAEIGKQPTIETSGNRKGYKVFGLIDYFTGTFYSKGHEGRLNADSYIEFLKEVLSKTRKHVILIQDGAPYHKAKKVKKFFDARKNRLSVFKLPSYSPDYNPIEKLWKKIKEKGVHMKFFPTFEDLKGSVQQMLDFFGEAKEEVLSLFGFYDELKAN